MTTTGHSAWCVTWLLTEPMRSLANPPLPRDPTTSMSASREALTSSSATSPVVALTVISGRVSPISFATLSTNCRSVFCANSRSWLFSGGGVDAPEDLGGRANGGRANGHNGQRDMVVYGLTHRPGEGQTRMVRAVHPDDDSGHLYSCVPGLFRFIRIEDGLEVRGMTGPNVPGGTPDLTRQFTLSEVRPGRPPGGRC
jgi:hypothetical protein